jgi:hypothetical protein
MTRCKKKLQKMTRASSVARLWTTTTEAEKTEGDGSVPVGFVPQPSATILELNLRNYGVGLVVGPTSIRYIGNGSHSTDVGAIQTSRPVPSCASVYYYEITILEKGERGYVSLGFADRAFKLNRQCGYVHRCFFWCYFSSSALMMLRSRAGPALPPFSKNKTSYYHKIPSLQVGKQLLRISRGRW